MDTAVFNEKLWWAIAEPSRRRLIDLLVIRGEASASGLAREVTISRQAVSKHLAVLKQAGLVWERKTKREVIFGVESATLNDASQELSQAAQFWGARLQKIKLLAEELHQQEELMRTKKGS